MALCDRLIYTWRLAGATYSSAAFGWSGSCARGGCQVVEVAGEDGGEAVRGGLCRARGGVHGESVQQREEPVGFQVGVQPGWCGSGEPEDQPAAGPALSPGVRTERSAQSVQRQVPTEVCCG